MFSLDLILVLDFFYHAFFNSVKLDDSVSVLTPLVLCRIKRPCREMQVKGVTCMKLY